MEHRRLRILFGVIALFAFGVIVWYFLFSKPKPAPTLDQPTDPFSLRDLPARFAFIFQDDGPTQTTETEVTLPGEEPFVRIWDKPTTGNVFITKQVLKESATSSTVGTTTVVSTKTVRATTTVLMFVDRITGYVYGHHMETGKTYQISNTTVPGVYDAHIFNGGSKIVMRHLGDDKKTIMSMFAAIPNIQPGNDPEPLADIAYLPQNISSVAVSSDLSELSYVVPTSGGATFYTINTKGVNRIAESPFSEWLVTYGGKQLYATPKPSAYLTGSTVLLPSFAPAISNKTGLISRASTNTTLLNSMWSQGGLLLFGTSRGVSTVASAKTLASKCAPLQNPYFICGVPKMLPPTIYGLPDDWLQGRVQFDDELVFINAANGDTTQLFEFEKKFGNMDVVHLSTHNGSELISFIRKQDGSLYLLNTKLIGDLPADHD